jgi:hypothetical protein
MIASGYLPKTTLMSDRIYGWQKTVKSSAGQLNRNSITTRTAPSIETQTGYRRMYKYAICQDIEVLEKITKYDFNLLCEGFIEYLADRGIIGVGTAENITVEQHIDIIQNWSDDEILNGEFYSESISGYRYTPEERKTTLRIHRIMKGKIQDAWEIFLLDVNS